MGENQIPHCRDDLGKRKADAEPMEFIEFEIIAPLTSPVVLLSGLALTLVLLSGLAAKTPVYIEDLRYRWKARRKARSFNQRPTTLRYGIQTALGMDIVR
jgi:hypothetical protein